MNAKKRKALLRQVNDFGKHAAGRTEYVQFLEGKLIAIDESIKAMCYSCMGYYADGRIDCQNDDCPLYRYMPYKGVKEDADVKVEEA